MSLGYMDLISMAEANKQSKQKELQRRQALLAKEKRVDPKQAKLKVGVQKFLAKKEEEERKRKEEELLKKRKLLELRNQDRKATSRVRKMINMTKSANKSVLAEADESFSEQVDAQAEETQPDEDDYGYTSTYEQEMYKKMLEKYKADAKKNPKPDNDMINRPKIHHLKPSSTSKIDSISQNKEKFDDNSKQPKRKPPPPPPPSFQELLEMAEKKSKEPVVIQKPMAPVNPKDGPEHYEFGRPMTKREKAKYLAEQALKERAAAMFSGNAPTSVSQKQEKLPQRMQDKNPPSSTSTNRPKKSFPPVNGFEERDSVDKRKVIKDKREETEKFKKPERSQESRVSSGRRSDKPNADSLDKRPISNNEDASWRKPNIPKPGNYKNGKRDLEERSTTTDRFSKRDEGSTRRRSRSRSRSPNRYVSSTFSALKNKPQRRPSVSSPPRHRSRSPSESISRSKSSYNARPVIESDEEYDSELDDFIDDGDIPGEDISSMIGQMFGYNKRKYINEDSDDECMESSVEQQMREEARSLRIGVMEDLEDMRREEEENRRKALMMKKRKLNK